MFGIFKKTLEKTTQNIKELLPKAQTKLSKEALEEILITADMDYDLVEMILSPLSQEISKNELEVALLRLFRGESYYDKVQIKSVDEKPCVDLIVGVNGAGKTTTIAKLANIYKKQGKSVILGAGDTFRAAAIEQLSLWANKLNIPIIASKIGHDPSAVAYDTITSAIAKKIDNVLLDTAGRLHNQTNLQNELQKILRICDKAKTGAPHRKILILDGTQGTSSLQQAKVFSQSLGGIDGVIITKLDGSSKGGAIFSIIHTLRTPILYIGTGESLEDIITFDENQYIQTILAGAMVSLSLSSCGNKDIEQNVNEKIIEVVELATDIGNEILEEVKNKEKFFYKDDIYFFVYPPFTKSLFIVFSLSTRTCEMFSKEGLSSVNWVQTAASSVQQ